MTYPRETIYSALFALLSSQAAGFGFQYFSRRGIVFADLTPDKLPALMMEQTGENQLINGRGMAYKWELNVMVALVVYAADASVIPASLLNPVVDSLEKVFPGGGNPQLSPQTLGGMVSEAKLWGDGKGNSGTMGNQAFSLIPIRIIAT